MVLLIATLISLVEIKVAYDTCALLICYPFPVGFKDEKIYTYLGNSHRNRFLEFSVSFKLCRTV